MNVSYKFLFGILIGLLILLQIVLWGENGLFKMWDLKHHITKQTAENEQYKEQNQDLIQEVLDIKSKADVIEEIAREELNMIKEGETFYRVIKHRDTNADDSGS